MFSFINSGYLKRPRQNSGSDFLHLHKLIRDQEIGQDNNDVNRASCGSSFFCFNPHMDLYSFLRPSASHIQVFIILIIFIAHYAYVSGVSFLHHSVYVQSSISEAWNFKPHWVGIRTALLSSSPGKNCTRYLIPY